MQDDRKYDLVPVTDERIVNIDKEACGPIYEQAVNFFQGPESPFSDAWERHRLKSIPHEVACFVQPVVQDVFDYVDRENGAVDPATFDYRFKIITTRKLDKTSFFVACAVRHLLRAQPAAVEEAMRVGLLRMEEFAVCECKVGKPCDRHVQGNSTSSIVVSESVGG